jgi:hypothetical protein
MLATIALLDYQSTDEILFGFRQRSQASNPHVNSRGEERNLPLFKFRDMQSPAELAIGPNPYEYSENNPINFKDPLGLLCDSSSNPARPCSECDEEYEENSRYCRKLTNPVARALCWARAAQIYADCLKDCK